MTAFAYPVDGNLAPIGDSADIFTQALADKRDAPVLRHFGHLWTTERLHNYYARLYADLGLPVPTFKGGHPS